MFLVIYMLDWSVLCNDMSTFSKPYVQSFMIIMVNTSGNVNINDTTSFLKDALYLYI